MGDNMKSVYLIRLFPKSKVIFLTVLFFLSLLNLNIYGVENQTETLLEGSEELKNFLADCEEEYSPRHCKRGVDFANQTKHAFYKMQEVLKKDQDENESLKKALPELRKYSLNPDEIDFQAFKSFEGAYSNEKCQEDFNKFFSEHNQSVLKPKEVEELCSLLDPGYLEGLSDRVHPYFKMASTPLNDYLNTDAGRNLLQNVAPLFAIYTFLPSIAKIFIKILEFVRVKDIQVTENLKNAFDRNSIREVHKKFFGHLFVLVPAFFAQNFKLYLVSHDFSHEWSQKFTFISLSFFYIHFTSHYTQHTNSIISKLDLARLKELSKSALALEHISDAIQDTLKDYDLTRIKALGSGMQLLKEVSVSPNQVLSSMNRFSLGFFALLSPVIAVSYDAFDWFLADYLSLPGFGVDSWFSQLFAVCSASYIMHYTLSKYHKRIQEIKDEREREKEAKKKKKEAKRKEKKSSSHDDDPSSPPHKGPSFVTSIFGSSGATLAVRPLGDPGAVLENLASERVQFSVGESLSPQEMAVISSTVEMAPPSLGVEGGSGEEILDEPAVNQSPPHSDAGPSAAKVTHEAESKEAELRRRVPAYSDERYAEYEDVSSDEYDSGDDLLEELSGVCSKSSKHCKDNAKKNK
jgi:hypothetical protein